MLRNMLEMLGFETIDAENGEEAINLVQQTGTDLILMDLVMPVIDGFEAIKLIRKDPSLRDIPIIVVSAGVLESDIEKSRQVGYDGFLSKPIREEKLFELLEKELNLAWIYSDPLANAADTDKTESPLISPPAEEMAILHELAQIGNMRDIQKQADHVATLGEQYIPFAIQLKRLAENFEEKSIVEMMEKFLNGS